MRRAAPLGSYKARRTPLHRADAGAKVLALLVVSVGAFAAPGPSALATVAVVVGVALAVAGVSGRELARAVRPTVLVLAFSLLANSLKLDGTGDVALVGMVGLSSAGAMRGAMAVGRIVTLVGAVCVMSATTTAPQLAGALARALAPLARIGVPVGDVAMVTSVTLRFVPEVMSEFDRIERAQRARGARFDEGSLPARVRVWAAVLIPLVIALFRRADELAEAMRDRCYGQEANK